METFNPGQTATVSFSGLPTGAVVGFQVLKATNGTVVIGRTTAGVTERPVGTGNFAVIFIAPVEGDIYFVVADWNNGVLTPEQSLIETIKVTTDVLPGSSGLGAIADYVKMNLGGETWKGLSNSVDYGTPFIQRAIDTIKRRVMTLPPASNAEGTLDPLLLDYLGVLAALELTTAARDYWGSQLITESVGDDPIEITTYPNRAALIKELREDLMAKRARLEPLALTLVTTPRLRSVDDGPAIDEDDDCRTTSDPREFVSFAAYPGGRPGRSEIIPRSWERIG